MPLPDLIDQLEQYGPQDYAALDAERKRKLADTNLDKRVNSDDTLNTISAWGSTEPPQPQPQPPTNTVQWTGANNQPMSLSITPPANPTPIVVHSGIQATNASDRVYTGDCVGAVKAFTCENNGQCHRVRVEGFNGTFKDYGVYCNGGTDIHVRDSVFTYAGGGVETYGYRGAPSEALFERVTINNTFGFKRSFRHYGGTCVVRDNCKLIGGCVELGHVDYTGTGIVVLIQDTKIEKNADDMPCAMRVLNGVGDAVFERVDFKGGGRACDIQGTFAGVAVFRQCTRDGRPLAKSDIGNDIKNANNQTDWSRVRIES